MDKNQLDEYKREMMKLYGQSRSRDEDPVPADKAEAPKEEKLPDNMTVPEEGFRDTVSPEIEDVNPNAADDTAWSEFLEKEPDNTVESGFLEEEPNDLDARFPPPDLSEIEEAEAAENIASEKDLGNSTGFILVNVRTGDESWAIEGALVVISALINGSRLMIASGIANSSGTTQLFEVPVPDLSLSQQPYSNIRPYSLYDISVTANGFFNARSVDVPVFSGITSIQNFSMIPVPLLMNESDETLTIYNEEPFFGTSKEQGE